MPTRGTVTHDGWAQLTKRGSEGRGAPTSPHPTNGAVTLGVCRLSTCGLSGGVSESARHCGTIVTRPTKRSVLKSFSIAMTFSLSALPVKWEVWILPPTKLTKSEECNL
eukprot:1984428-Prymnesium_polylepis.1